MSNEREKIDNDQLIFEAYEKRIKKRKAIILLIASLLFAGSMVLIDRNAKKKLETNPPEIVEDKEDKDIFEFNSMDIRKSDDVIVHKGELYIKEPGAYVYKEDLDKEFKRFMIHGRLKEGREIMPITTKAKNGYSKTSTVGSKYYELDEFLFVIDKNETKPISEDDPTMMNDFYPIYYPANNKESIDSLSDILNPEDKYSVIINEASTFKELMNKKDIHFITDVQDIDNLGIASGDNITKIYLRLNKDGGNIYKIFPGIFIEGDRVIKIEDYHKGKFKEIIYDIN